MLNLDAVFGVLDKARELLRVAGDTPNVADTLVHEAARMLRSAADTLDDTTPEDDE